MAKKKTGNSVADLLNSLQGKYNSSERTVVAMASEVEEIDYIPTGIVNVDEILGGGLPRGRIVDIYGAEGSGKTAIAMSYIAQAQKFGPCAWVDLENSFDPQKAVMSGIDLDDLIMVNAMAAEDVFAIMIDLLETDDLVSIVVDSWAGFVPEAEIHGDVGDSHVGLVARLSSQFFRIVGPTLARSDKTLVAINQERSAIPKGGYGPTKMATGGKAIKFYATTRLEVARIGWVEKSDRVIGQKVQVKTVKSRLSRPQQKTVFQINFDHGISNEPHIIELAVKYGIFAKKGSWYADMRTGENIGQGEAAVADVLRNDKAFTDELLAEIQKARDDENSI